MPRIDTTVLLSEFRSDTVVNPATERAEDTTVEWMWRIGLLATSAQEAHARSFEFGLYHGIATPEVDHDRLVLGLMWFYWGSLADDQYDSLAAGERTARIRDIVRAMHAITDGERVAPDNPIVAGFADFWPRLTAGMSARGRQRIADHFLDYLQAVQYQNIYHASGRIPDLATFISMRRQTIAMCFQADVLAVVCALRIPDAILDSFLFRELVLCFADITAWHNDIYGLSKDIVDGQTCNLVRVLATQDGDLDRAVRRALAMAESRQHVFLELQDELARQATESSFGPAVANHCAELALAMRRYVYANLVWVGSTRRYDTDVPRVRGTFDNLITAATDARA